MAPAHARLQKKIAICCGVRKSRQITCAMARAPLLGGMKTDASSLIRDLAKLIGFAPEITLIGVAIDKQKIDLTSSHRVIRPEVRSLELLLERYDGFLDEQRDKAGVVILDACEESKDDNLRYFQSYLLDQGTHFRRSQIVEGTFFAKSHTSGLLQLADFCSNVFYHHVSGRTANPEFTALHPRFWRRGSRIRGYGIEIWPA